MKRMLVLATLGAALMVSVLAGAAGASGYCLNGRFVEVGPVQQATDPLYTAAVPATYVEGSGLTCDNLPQGVVVVPDKLVNGTGTDLGSHSGDNGRIYPFAQQVRAGYCNGGTFMNLLLGQIYWDPQYFGLTHATYIEGSGISCHPLPTGYAYTGAFSDSTGHTAVTTSDLFAIYRYAARA